MTRVALVIAALTAAFILGRVSAPAKTLTVERLVEVQAEEKTARAVEETAGNERVREVAGPVRTVWRTKTVPGSCEAVTEVERIEGATEKTSESSSLRAASTVEGTTKLAINSRESVRIVERPKDRWGLVGNVGMGLDGKPRYGGELTRDMGPLRFGVGVDVPTRAAVVKLGLTW
ncbi:MAG TPA: hypothetical protein VD948_11220 [Rhodothermales bacterium]|nr:hypothetical protein [Rhodothermales bacterium]